MELKVREELYSRLNSTFNKKLIQDKGKWMVWDHREEFFRGL